MREALVGAWVAIATFVPKLLLFLVILIIGMIVAKVLAKAIDKILTRVGFDRAVERGGIKKALDKSKYDASAIVGKIVYYFLLLFVLQLAFGVFGSNPISDLLTAIITFLPRLFVALIIIVLASAIAAAAKGLIQNTLGGLSYGKALANIAGVFILGLGVIAALNQVGIATTVTTPVLITVLGTVAGILIVGVGGGLIKPMQNRWEGYLTKAEEEAPRIKEHADAAPSVKEQAQQAKAKAQQVYDQNDPARQASSYDTAQPNPAVPYNPPGQYNQQNQPGQYSEQNQPGQYGEQIQPGQYSEQNQPGQYNQQNQPGQYGEQNQPGQYGEQNQPGQPDQYGQQNQQGQYGPSTNPPGSTSQQNWSQPNQ